MTFEEGPELLEVRAVPARTTFLDFASVEGGDVYPGMSNVIGAQGEAHGAKPRSITFGTLGTGDIVQSPILYMQKSDREWFLVLPTKENDKGTTFKITHRSWHEMKRDGFYFLFHVSEDATIGSEVSTYFAKVKSRSQHTVQGPPAEFTVVPYGTTNA